MELGWEPTVDDLRDAFEARKRRRARGRTSRTAVVVLRVYVYGAVLCLAAVPTLFMGGNIALGLVITLVGILTLVKFGWVLSSPGQTGRLAEKIYAKHELARLPAHVVVNADGISSAAGAASFRYTWDKVEEVLETPDSFVGVVRPERGINLFSGIMFTAGMRAALPLPKRGLADPARVPELRALIESCLGKQVIQVPSSEEAGKPTAHRGAT